MRWGIVVALAGPSVSVGAQDHLEAELVTTSGHAVCELRGGTNDALLAAADADQVENRAVAHSLDD